MFMENRWQINQEDYSHSDYEISNKNSKIKTVQQQSTYYQFDINRYSL